MSLIHSNDSSASDCTYLLRKPSALMVRNDIFVSSVVSDRGDEHGVAHAPDIKLFFINGVPLTINEMLCNNEFIAILVNIVTDRHESLQIFCSNAPKPYMHVFDVE
jgi:hypothetical protein